MPSPLTIDTVILIRLATVQQVDLHRLLSQAWRMIAPERLLTRVETMPQSDHASNVHIPAV